MGEETEQMINKILNFFGIETITEGNKRIEMAKAKTFVNSDYENIGDSEYNQWYNYLQQFLQRQMKDKDKYDEYDLMDNETPEISTALDILTDFVIYASNTHGNKSFQIKSKNKIIEKHIENLLDRVDFFNHFPSMLRSAFKYGDNWEEMIPNNGNNKIVSLRNIPVRSVVPNIKNGVIQSTPMIKQVNVGGKEIARLNSNEVFRLSIFTDRLRLVEYGKGTSVIEKCRLLYRQVRLMEEGLMITRLSRANQNYAMIVDVGELQGDDALNYLDKYKKRMMRRKYVNKDTGKWSWEYNPLSVIEDIMIPTRQGSGGNIIPLNDSGNIGKNIEDIQYFENKMIYSTGVPKLLIGKEEDINSKSTSDVQMSSFYRTIRRYQTAIEPMIIEFIVNALTKERIKVNKNDIKIEWGLIDSVDEKRKWEIEKLKLEVASMLSQDLGVVDDLYIYTKIMGMSEEEALTLIARLDAEEEQMSTEIDDMLAQADDKTMEDDDGTFDDIDQTADKKKRAKVKQLKQNKKDKEKQTEPTEEELKNYIKSKLGEKDYSEWLKIQELLDNNPKIQETLCNVILMTQAQLGE